MTSKYLISLLFPTLTQNSKYVKNTWTCLVQPTVETREVRRSTVSPMNTENYLPLQGVQSVKPKAFDAIFESRPHQPNVNFRTKFTGHFK